jgi:preprotein translocase subunit SecD
MKRITTSFITAFLLVGIVTQSRAAETRSLTFNALESEPLLTSRDFTRAQVTTVHGKSVLQATLTDTGSEKLKEYTLKHVGQKLAIMRDGQIIAAPVIRVPLGGNLEIDGVSKSEAVTLAHLINGDNAN